MTLTRHFGWTTIALIGLVGCGVSTPTTLTPPTASTSAPKDGMEVKSIPADSKVDAPDKLSDDEIAEIKKLSPEDQTLAMAQMTCPVSDEKLGGMGVPLKQTIGDKTFFICCSGCEKTVKNEPDKVMAKLKK